MKDYYGLFQEAIREWQAAEAAFNQSDREYLDYHVYRLQAAEEKLSLILRQAKSSQGLEILRLPRGPLMAALNGQVSVSRSTERILAAEDPPANAAYDGPMRGAD